MTLVKAKSRTTTNMRRVRGDHHRKNQKYTKTYWPYIPVVFILGGSLVASEYLPVTVGATGSTRVGAVLGSNNRTLILMMELALVVLVSWFVVRHFKRIKTLIAGGEHVLARHYTLDVLLGMIIGCLYILVN
jgi:hypothetical protein